MNPSQTSTESSLLPPKRALVSKSKKKILLGVVAAILLGTAASFGLYRHPAAPAKPSITLYYSDGKTVLWQDNDPAVAPTAQPANAPYFVDLARAELQKRFGGKYYMQGAWSVTTTLDASLQSTAEQLVASNLTTIANNTNGKADEEATVLEDVTTGQIKALVGGVDRSNADHGQINFATTPLAPGSSIKPFDYAALIDGTNAGAGTAVSDVQAPLPGWPCTDASRPTSAGLAGNCLWNYDNLYFGAMPLRYALGTNRNVPAVQAGNTVGIQNVIDLIKNMGAENGYNCYAGADFSQKTQCYGASLLGDGAYLTLADETHALATLADGGKKLPQTTIVSAKLNGKVKAAWQQPAGQQALKPDAAYIINDIMADPNASYLPGSCDANNCTSDSLKFQRDNGWHFAVDTGVTYNGHGAVMASWSPQYAVVSWVGNHAGNQAVSSSSDNSAATLTEPLTRGLMHAAHASKTPIVWAQPVTIQTLPALVMRFSISGATAPSPATDIYPSWYKQP